jgi:hypothetical protein
MGLFIDYFAVEDGQRFHRQNFLRRTVRHDFKYVKTVSMSQK